MGAMVGDALVGLVVRVARRLASITPVVVAVLRARMAPVVMVA